MQTYLVTIFQAQKQLKVQITFLQPVVAKDILSFAIFGFLLTTTDYKLLIWVPGIVSCRWWDIKCTESRMTAETTVVIDVIVSKSAAPQLDQLWILAHPSCVIPMEMEIIFKSDLGFFALEKQSTSWCTKAERLSRSRVRLSCFSVWSWRDKLGQILSGPLTI